MRFSQRDVSEAQATAMYGRGSSRGSSPNRESRRRAAYLGTRSPEGADNFYHNPALFQAILKRDGIPIAAGAVQPRRADGGRPSGQSVRFGLMDESGKLNLNALMQANMTDEQREVALSWLPGMTPDIARSILDFLDPDDSPRPTGGGVGVLQDAQPPYEAKNGPLNSLDELLLVRGVLPAMLYGEDANRNGLLDGNEDDGAPSRPRQRRRHARSRVERVSERCRAGSRT